MLLLADINHGDSLNDMISAADKGLSLSADNTKVITGHEPEEKTQPTDNHQILVAVGSS